MQIKLYILFYRCHPRRFFLFVLITHFTRTQPSVEVGKREGCCVRTRLKVTSGRLRRKGNGTLKEILLKKLPAIKYFIGLKKDNWKWKWLTNRTTVDESKGKSPWALGEPIDRCYFFFNLISRYIEILIT